MTTLLEKRLDQLLPRVTQKDFLNSEGIGNEIACYIFDYEASDELKVRKHLSWMIGRFKSHHSALNVLHLNLLDEVLRYLRDRKLFDRVLDMQSKKGTAAVLKALRGALAAERLRKAIEDKHHLSSHDLVIISGVGSIWPMMRVHGLLNSLHTVMGQTPLVLFYPGSFDGTALKLFGRIPTSVRSPTAKQYYRAFQLIPREAQK
jgi:hypothetical protein